MARVNETFGSVAITGTDHGIPAPWGRGGPAGSLTVGLAGTGRAEQDHVGPGGDEVAHPEVDDELSVQVGAVGEVEVLEGLQGGEPGPADPGVRDRSCRGQLIPAGGVR